MGSPNLDVGESLVVASAKANNGMLIESVVIYLGCEKKWGAKIKTPRWRTEDRIDGCMMAHSHHDDLASAEAEARKGHACYMKIHSTKRIHRRKRAETSIRPNYPDNLKPRS